jgi:hypothetical protein
MTSLLKTSSWVVIENITNKAIFETFNESLVNKINVKKYTAIPILKYLQNFNKTI